MQACINVVCVHLRLPVNSVLCRDTAAGFDNRQQSKPQGDMYPSHTGQQGHFPQGGYPQAPQGYPGGYPAQGKSNQYDLFITVTAVVIVACAACAGTLHLCMMYYVGVVCRHVYVLLTVMYLTCKEMVCRLHLGVGVFARVMSIALKLLHAAMHTHIVVHIASGYGQGMPQQPGHQGFPLNPNYPAAQGYGQMPQQGYAPPAQGYAPTGQPGTGYYPQQHQQQQHHQMAPAGAGHHGHQAVPGGQVVGEQTCIQNMVVVHVTF